MAQTGDRLSVRIRNGVLSIIEGAFGGALRGAKTQAEALTTLGLSFPLPVNKGGTGNAGGAWTTYAPTFTAADGGGVTFAGAGAYLQIGKTLFVRVALGLNYTGAAPTRFSFTLPAGLSWKDVTAGSAVNHSAGLVLGASSIGNGTVTVYPSTTQLVTGSGQYLAAGLAGEVA